MQEVIDDIPLISSAEYAELLVYSRSLTGTRPVESRAESRVDSRMVDAEEKLRVETAKSKTLGNWRTGLLATNTATSGVATIFNATQIGAIKRAVNIAAECEEAL